MLIFTSAYVLLALASWSALAAPLSGSERDDENVAAQKRSLSSSILMDRQVQPQPWMWDTTGIDKPNSDKINLPSQSSTMDCDTKPKPKPKPNDKTNDQLYTTVASNTNPNPTSTTTGPLPAIARRRSRSPMRRDSNDPPSIFERDDAPNTVASGNPITVRDVLAYYLKQRAAARKRAPSPRTSRNFN